MAVWIPEWACRLPLLHPFRDIWPARHAHWPTLLEMQRALLHAGAVNRAGMPLQLISHVPSGALDYERSVFARGQLPVREGDWHDFFNVMAWMTFPRTKAALNAAHCTDRDPALPGRRSRRRDKLTLFDESGVIVLSDDLMLAQLIREHRWHEFFWQRREALLSSVRFLPFGHGLCEKALTPYIGMTGQALLLEVGTSDLAGPTAGLRDETDERLASLFSQDLPANLLTPLPLLGIPGWHRDNDQERFYANTQYFRAMPAGRRATAAR
jgi:hypothetical protein